jgi:hypothetical protein
VKIRWRNLRTFASATRQSTACQPLLSSSSPFTTSTRAVAASNLSSGSGIIAVFLFTDSPDHVSALSRPGTRPGIRPVIHDDQLKALARLSWFPAAFRLPALASWSSCSRRGIGLSSRSAYPPLERGRTWTGFPCFTRTSCDRGGSPLYSGDNGAHPGPESLTGQRPPRSQRHPCGALLDEASTKGSNDFSRPIFPSPDPVGWNDSALGLNPELRTPRLLASARRGGDRSSSTDLNQRSTS